MQALHPSLKHGLALLALACTLGSMLPAAAQATDNAKAPPAGQG